MSRETNIIDDREPQVQIAQVNLSAQADGSAVVSFNVFGLFDTSIKVPRPIVLAFIKQWGEQEKQRMEITQAVTNLRSKH